MSATCRHVFGDMTFSLCPKESANISADIVPTGHVMLSSKVWMTEFDEMSGQHPRHFPDIFPTASTRVGATCHLGGALVT